MSKLLIAALALSGCVSQRDVLWRDYSFAYETGCQIGKMQVVEDPPYWVLCEGKVFYCKIEIGVVSCSRYKSDVSDVERRLRKFGTYNE